MFGRLFKILKEKFKMNPMPPMPPPPVNIDIHQHGLLNESEERLAHPIPQDIMTPEKVHAMRIMKMQAARGQVVDPWEGALIAAEMKQNNQHMQQMSPAPQMYQQPMQQQYVPMAQPQPQIPQLQGEFEISPGVKIKIEGGKLMKQQWVKADVSTHRLNESGEIEELQWISIKND